MRRAPPTTGWSIASSRRARRWTRRSRWRARSPAKSPAIVAIGKEAFYAQLELPVSDAYAYASEVMVRNMMHRDAEEGIGAFIEKRPPDWKGD